MSESLDTSLVNSREASEAEFHDHWATSERVEDIDIELVATAATSPELRYIIERLGDVLHKRILDVGCGLGEMSVFFAKKGANVTSLDVSSEMVAFAQRLAIRYGTTVAGYHAVNGKIDFPAGTKFDVIYLGNLLHHVDIDPMIQSLKGYLSPGGLWVSWDPVQYNPVINVYRKMAADVRTPDEHPFRVRDVQTFRRHFAQVETSFFWFSTLIIFILMWLFQGNNPGKVRFWKLVIYQSKKWEWLYFPLEKLDRILLKIFAPLRWLCWNVVVIASNPEG